MRTAAPRGAGVGRAPRIHIGGREHLRDCATRRGRRWRIVGPKSDIFGDALRARRREGLALYMIYDITREGMARWWRGGDRYHGRLMARRNWCQSGGAYYGAGDFYGANRGVRRAPPPQPTPPPTHPAAWP